jgi:hypothetical protein
MTLYACIIHETFVHFTFLWDITNCQIVSQAFNLKLENPCLGIKLTICVIKFTNFPLNSYSQTNHGQREINIFTLPQSMYDL